MAKNNIIKNILKRALYPHHLYRVIKLQRNRKRGNRHEDDAQLKLYAKILKGDFLHYGYFDNANIQAEDISLNMIYQAQKRYAEKLVELISDKHTPALDVGCGMGGLLKLLNENNINAIGLTPDNTQIKHITSTYPNKVLHCRFEDIKVDDYINHFGTVITSESLQYLQLDKALPIIDKIMKPGGTWVACDYFRLGKAHEKSGHNWESFNKLLTEHGFKMTKEENITPHILPTIAYIYMWATQIGMPVKEFLIEKIKVKNPGLYYMIEKSLPEIDGKLEKNINIINPTLFALEKKYVLMRIERV